MRVFWFIVLLVSGLTSQLRAEVLQSLTLTTPRGAEVGAVVHYPQAPDSSDTKLPVIIIAPGGGYHMNLPIITELASQSVAQGMIAIRFNWHYFTAGVSGSADFSTEIEDLQTILDHVKTMSGVDQTRIFLAGKSNGSIVSYAVYHRQPDDVFALFLLTPICNENSDIATYYPGLAEVKDPTVIVLGNQDEMCALQYLYSGLKTAPNHITTIIVAGDHGLNLGSYDDPAFADINASNIKTAVGMLAYWERILLSSSK